jgi:hypothetical protein
LLGIELKKDNQLKSSKLSFDNILPNSLKFYIKKNVSNITHLIFVKSHKITK